MWATVWMHGANEVIAPLLDLPHLRVADLPAYDGDHGVDDLQWKTKVLVRVANGRPFVWVDDVLGDADQRWIESVHLAGALLHRVDPTVGMTVTDVDRIVTWLRGSVAR